MIWHILLVIISQFGFIFFRTLNVKYVADNVLVGAMITGLAVNVLWITTTGYGLTALYEKNWVLGIAYLVGGQIGVYYGMRKDRITKYILNQWLNLKIAFIDLYISWFVTVTEFGIEKDYRGEAYFHDMISWNGYVMHSDFYTENIHDRHQMKRKFSDFVTSAMIDRFYKKQITIA